MRVKKYVCLLLCIIMAIMPMISLAEGEQTEKEQETVQEESTKNSDEVVQETPVVEETQEVEKETSNEQLNTKKSEAEVVEETEPVEEEQIIEEVPPKSGEPNLNEQELSNVESDNEEKQEGEQITEDVGAKTDKLTDNTTEPVKDDTKEEDLKNNSDEQPKQEEKDDKEQSKEEEKKEESADKKEPEFEEEIVEVNYNTNNGSTSAYVGDTREYDPEIGTVLRYPLSAKGIITTYFGAIDSLHSTPHQGLDIAIAQGTPIVACDNGTVTRAEWWGGYGNMVEITHSDGMVTRYGHMSEINVKQGEIVVRGQMIGKVGNTGRSFGAHLHLEVYPRGGSAGAVNPLPYLEKEAKDETAEYCNVKIVLVNEENKLTILDSLISMLQSKLSDEEQEEVVFNYDDVYVQFNERLDIEIEDGKTIVDISKYYNNGLLVNEPIYIQSQEGYNIIYDNYNLIIDEELTQSEVQIIIPSKKIEKTKVLTYVYNDLGEDNIELCEFNPLFGIEYNLNINDITKENLQIKVDDKTLTHNYYDYQDGVLKIKYSPLNISQLEINVLKDVQELEELPEIEDIHNITSWLTTNQIIDVIGLNSSINGCYFINSILVNEVDSEYSITPYHRYNFEKNEDNEVVSNLLVDNDLSDGYIAIPIEQFLSTTQLSSEVDPKTLGINKEPSQQLAIKDRQYNVLIYGEQLNLLDDIQIADGPKSVKFNLLDYYTNEDTSYFIVSYQVEGIGGYFGIQVQSKNQDN